MKEVVLVSFIFLLVATGCSSNPDKQAGGEQVDSLVALSDSSDLGSLGEECYLGFFNNLPKFPDSNSAFLVMGEGPRVRLNQFFEDEFMSSASQYGTKDLDGDGVPELIIYNHTGGAHCCDEYYVFSKKADNEFVFKAHLMGGNTCIDAASNTFSFSFSETFGYFFSCYSCQFSDSTTALKPMHEIFLKYTGGRLQIIPYDEAAEKQNLANLEVLRNHGYEKVDGLMDNGWRKEFALNFAVWHFNHGQKWNETKALFDKHYPFEDAPKIWSEFYSTLRDSRKENTF